MGLFDVHTCTRAWHACEANFRLLRGTVCRALRRRRPASLDWGGLPRRAGRAQTAARSVSGALVSAILGWVSWSTAAMGAGGGLDSEQGAWVRLGCVFDFAGYA